MSLHTRQDLALAKTLTGLDDDTLIDVTSLAALLCLTPESARQAAYRSPEALPPRFQTASRHLRYRIGTAREWIRNRSMLPPNGDAPQAQPTPAPSAPAADSQDKGKPNRLGTSTKAERVRLQRLGEQLKQAATGGGK